MRHEIVYPNLYNSHCTLFGIECTNKCELLYTVLNVLDDTKINLVCNNSCKWYCKKVKKQKSKVKKSGIQKPEKRITFKTWLFILDAIIRAVYINMLSDKQYNLINPFLQWSYKIRNKWEKISKGIKHTALTFDKILNDAISVDLENNLEKITKIILYRNKALVSVYGFDIIHDIAEIFWNYIKSNEIIVFGVLEFKTILSLIDKKMYVLNQEYGTKAKKMVKYLMQYNEQTEKNEYIKDKNGKRIKIYEDLLSNNQIFSSISNKILFGNIYLDSSYIIDSFGENDVLIKPTNLLISKSIFQFDKTEENVISDLRKAIEQDKREYQKAIEKLRNKNKK